MTSIRFLFLIGFALFGIMAVGARAETPEFLVEERARQVWGAELPEAAHIRIRLADTHIERAELLSAFWMDRETGRFLANAVTEDGRVTRIEGLALVTVTLPVPNRRMMPGEIVTEADVTMVELPVRRIGSYSVTDPGNLVGMEVKRMLPQGRQVMTQSITQPRVVTRGDRVEIQFDDGRMVLTAPGRALDDAHRGQELRIVNLVSNKSLRAVARAEGIVEIIR
ncbi:flagellar basal body P-ring biosynthesis protein FlgA [Oceanicola sp. 22II-s10i]|uniref:flagellar basal body P-ring formation chaperone FlgA n=1 Tax=Oceanicola sp. 22II-s10i TaxID=1317116 RepID=UPI000B529275|nr:flagellar basal body P-ring formation chaperone FlgA [Oceanicola sp. 22II-s10i]OWU83187.1 flagellar basal body P-ring biosynthesis protein FlgA [Oceanicola sp. 22II-s10i]